MKNIDSEEKEVLIQEKLRSGMGIDQAVEEVERDREFIGDLNQEKKNLEEEVKDLKKKKEKLNKVFKKEFTKLTEPEKLIKKSKAKHANTKHLSRIIYYLKESPNQTVTKIAEENCMTTTTTSDGLVFLMKLDIVEQIKKQGSKLYKLKARIEAEARTL